MPDYDNPAAVDAAIAAAKDRYDHAEAQHDPDVLALIRAAEAMRAKLYDPESGTAAALAEEAALRERMSALLTGVARGLKGDPPPLVMHDWSDLPALAAEMRVKLYGPADGDPMPVFVIKAKDWLAPYAVSAYSVLCEAQGLIGQSHEVDQAVREMHDWQFRNRGLVKMPDHKHVPAAGTR